MPAPLQVILVDALVALGKTEQIPDFRPTVSEERDHGDISATAVDGLPRRRKRCGADGSGNSGKLGTLRGDNARSLLPLLNTQPLRNARAFWGNYMGRFGKCFAAGPRCRAIAPYWVIWDEWGNAIVDSAAMLLADESWLPGIFAMPKKVSARSKSAIHVVMPGPPPIKSVWQAGGRCEEQRDHGHSPTAEILEIAGCLVTIDAMGCQTKIAQAILDAKADYVLAVKSNQQTLYDGLAWLLSKKLSAKRFATAVRSHWSIQNRLPWQLDVAFQEDQSRLRRGHADANFSILRRTALSLLKNNHAIKVGVKNKRLAAGWDDSYLEQILFGQ